MYVNTQYFDSKQIEAGELDAFVKILMSAAYGKGKYYNDIHIVPTDLGAFIVEWLQVPWDHSSGGRFASIDEDEVIMKEYKMPDGSYQFFENKSDYEEAINDYFSNVGKEE